MEYQRIILIGALVFVSFLLWQAWEKDYPRVSQSIQQKTVPQLSNGESNQDSTQKSTNNQTSIQAIAQQKHAKKTKIKISQVPAERIIEVQTDVLHIKIDTLGGKIIGSSLPKYPQELNVKDKPLILFNDNPNSLYTAESNLISQQGPDTLKEQAQYKTDKKQYTLVDNQNNLNVTLKWHNPQGLLITKTFEFKRDSYLINVTYHVDNQTKSAWEGNLYTQLTRKDVNHKSGGLFGLHTYSGTAISSPEKRYKEISFKDLAETPINKTIKGGWAAMVEHYFVSAWIPDQQQKSQYYSQVTDGNIYTIGMVGPKLTITPGEQLTIGSRLYSGPEEVSRLKKIAPGLDLTVSYGWLWPISVVIFWLMKHIYDVVGNWGWAIILVTVLIKLVFYRLSATSYRSMANMRKLQPKIKILQERYKDDKQKLSKEMMAMYKKEKANPLGGCLPIIVQIPVFFALYMVLIESVELRQAPFILWIHDLSVPDPFYVLPILMGITMFIQQKLNPAPPDPTQAKVMMFLPVVFTVLFINFPAGLVLYWVVNNALSILQQWHITRKVEMGMMTAKKKSK